MPEHPGFELRQVNGRSMVHLRVRPEDADSASVALSLPDALRWQGEDPVTCWLGPDQWLITSDTHSAEALATQVSQALSAQLHAAIDMSSAYVCFELEGLAARTVLAMGCGMDMHPQAFKTGHCVRTLFAGMSVIIVATRDDRFDLYLDRSLAGHFQKWLAVAREDPLTVE